MTAMREKDQGDFDLDRFVDMMDEALTSRDPRVVQTLRDLMMIVALTRPEASKPVIEDRERGPLRRLKDDVDNLNRRLWAMEEKLDTILRKQKQAVAEREWPYQEEKYTLDAAQQIAMKMDQDVINQLKARAKGLYEK